MGKSIYIHAGAHRTGTSSFQHCLHDNRALLQGLGLDVAYPGRDGVPRGKLRLRLPSPRHKRKSAPDFAAIVASHIDALSPDKSRRLILSEENIPGRMFHFLHGQFYPAAELRLTALAKALVSPPKHILFVVRSYDEMYMSGYRKRAEDNAVAPFENGIPNYLAMDRGWPELIAMMRDILRPEQISVLPYEHRGQSRALLGRLMPELDVNQLAEPSRLMNLSATDAALEVLQKHYHAGDDLTRPQWKDIVQTYSDNREQRGFAAFSDQDAEVLQHRYQEDLSRIADLDDVTFL